jgi:hypothetical protein
MMSKMKTFKMEIEDDLRSKGNYCCYCVQPQDGKISCCQENHFIPFDDLYEEDKESLIQGEVGEYEAWSKKQ